MAAQLSLAVSFRRTLRSFGTTAFRCDILPVPNPTGVFSVSRTHALRNPTRHDVTTMAPQDFPLCAAFQEE